MSLIILGRKSGSYLRATAAVVAAACLAAGCGNAPSLSPAERPLSKDTMMMLGKKGMETGAPIFVRIFKEESELEVWKARDDGRFYHFKTYPICNWSGMLGPKTAYGDMQAPEGFYKVNAWQMKPDSKYYLAFNIGYPNAYDRAWNRTGDSLMIHGKCRSAGCYAMTDALMEEIYGLAREALKGGQTAFDVHAYPFRMTAENMARHKKNRAYPFWTTLKQGYDFFELTHLPPEVAVCERRYVVNVKLPQTPIDPEGACPRFVHPVVAPFTPKPNEEQLAAERITIPGPKMHDVASAAPEKGWDTQMMGLTKAPQSRQSKSWWTYLGLDKLY
jgi:murein L,D-transpeptidase YafK